MAARKSVLGASDVAAVLGLAPASWGVTPLGVWLEKTDPEYAADEPTERMLWGLRLERPIADEFRVRHAKELGVYVAPTPGLIGSVEHPWLACTPDRVLLDAVTRKTALGLLEIKTGGYTTIDQWKDGVPYHYQIQTQIQMGVTGMPYCYVVPLFGGNRMPEPHRLEFDALAYQQIVEITGEWWREHVVARVPPEPLVADLDVLAEVWPGDGSKVVLPDDLVQRARLRVRLRERVAQLEDAMARVDLALKVAMKDAAVATDPDGYPVAQWTRYTRRGFDRKRFAREHPGLNVQYTTQTPSQRFTVRAEKEETT